MDASEFQRLCLRTERPIDQEVVDRFEDVAGGLYFLLREVSGLAEAADQFKKKIFYGKPGVTSDADIPPETVLRMDEDLRAIHGLLGLISETGELVDAYVNYYDGNTPCVDQVNVLEEVGDVGWYCSVLASSADGDLSEAFEAVTDKLAERYPEKFSEQSALERNLEAERRALENRIDGTGLF